MARTIIIALVFSFLFTMVGCSDEKSVFTAESINTKDVAFAGMSGSSISASNIVLEGKIGRKPVELSLKSAFGDCTIQNLTGTYENAFTFNPDIASISLVIIDEDGGYHSFDIAAGDTFTVDTSGEKTILLFPD